MASLGIIFILIMLLIFILTNHPLAMALSLMLTSMLMGVTLSTGSPSSWVSYMLVMIFVSGMMIIILYMASLSSNEVITPSNFAKKTYLLFFIGSLLFFTNPTPLYATQMNEFFKNPLFSMVYKTYTQLMNPMTTLIIFYLLIVLVTAVNIIKTSKIPLRSSA